MEYMDSVVSVYKNNIEMMGYLYLGLIVLCIYFVITLFNSGGRSKTNNSGSRKKRDDTLRELQTTVLKDHATIEALTLLVGALTRKVESFEVIVNNIDQKINERIVNHTENIEVTLSDIGHDVDNMRNDYNEKFAKIQRNFTVLGNKLGEFTDDEYRKSMANITEQVREMKGAIFLPDEEDDNDSEYQQ